MTERRDIPDALREAVERTVQATLGTRDLAQDAASELSASVDELMKGAEKGLSRSRRTVRAVVEERLPATQDDVKAIRAELRRIGKRLDGIEERLAVETKPKAAPRPRTASKATASKASASKARTAPKAKTAGKAKPARKAKSTSTARAKPKR